MTVGDVKKLAKDKYGKDITDEQAREVLNNAQAAAKGEISDEALDAVSGGFNWKAAAEIMIGVGLEELAKKL